MIWAAWAAASVALAGAGVAPDVVVVAICGAITYFGLTYGNLLWGALMQVAVPAQMLGPAPGGPAVAWAVVLAAARSSRPCGKPGGGGAARGGHLAPNFPGIPGKSPGRT